MTDYKEIYSFTDSWYVKHISIGREFPGGPLTADITFTNDDEEEHVRLIRPDDGDIVTALLDAERIVISKELGSQREFGSYRVECFSESYSEYWCDSVE